MKRIRDDVYVCSPNKRPCHGESYGQSQIPDIAAGDGGRSEGGAAVSSQKSTPNDALTYLKEVKDMFQDQMEKYDMFLEVMKDFNAHRTDTLGVIARVKELFKGHNNLIFGFNTFLPKRYEITLHKDEIPLKETVEFEGAINFVNKVKKRFQNDEHVYKSFLDIFNMYQNEHKDICEIYGKVAAIFEDHRDLLDEFTRFLPDTSVAPMTQDALYCGSPIQNFDEQNFSVLTSRQMHVHKHRSERDVASHAEHDLSVDQPVINNEKAMVKHKDLRKFDRTKSALKDEGFVRNSNISFSDDGMCRQGIIVCEKVREKLGSLDDYKAFLKCLGAYCNGMKGKNDLQNLMTDFLGRYPDLMEEFNDFLERCAYIDGFIPGVMSKKSPANGRHASKGPLKLENKDKEQKRELDAAKYKERNRDMYMSKSIQDLDLSKSTRCTPSYRLLPHDYPIPSASRISLCDEQILNDHWVSVTSGSEDYSSKHMCKNQYEEIMFRCEDDRFELDMLIETVASTLRRANKCLNSITENKNGTPIHIEDHFTAQNLRCIEHIYGDYGLDFIDILRTDPTTALPVFCTRLEQKKEELTRCREGYKKVWAKVYAKNYHKSLDHASTSTKKIQRT